ncbi:MAG: hypothetical protein ACD_7C00466G0002 [uncultured bacterium]|nr:MAG: hypothetical protein ACD_7C00466G0002 [uncultured bacterium]
MNHQTKGFRLYQMAQSYFVAVIKLLKYENIKHDKHEFSMAFSPFEVSFLPNKDNPFCAAPVLYLMRLSFELMLKSIHYNVRACGIETPIFKNIEKTHDLNALYSQLFDVESKIKGIEKVFSTHSIIPYKLFIQLLADFTTYDPKGDIFRFGFTKSGSKLKIFDSFSKKDAAEAYIMATHKANEFMCRINSFLEVFLKNKH